ncbi:MAG: hypothetical protein MZV63_59390 [Marinilabiliales bacterium]|nr:hypothetical protein [Marinilabiliales bacterium]
MRRQHQFRRKFRSRWLMKQTEGALNEVPVPVAEELPAAEEFHAEETVEEVAPEESRTEQIIEETGAPLRIHGRKN